MLLLDGAKCHFDYSIAETAEKNDIVLLCLPSNTTHELQPFDESVFRSLERAWDDELNLYWERTMNRTVTKWEFCKIFTKAWARSAIPCNIASGFEACGMYPFNPNRIPEEAYAPSMLMDNSAPEETNTPQQSGVNQSTSSPGRISRFRNCSLHKRWT